jgi:hypothetical protein
MKYLPQQVANTYRKTEARSPDTKAAGILELT